MVFVIVALHLVGWSTLIGVIVPQHLALGRKTFDIGIGVTAYVLGIRHALDADHIAAIDNTTRKLIGTKERPISVGFWFATGHSTVVFVLAVLFALGARSFAGSFFDKSSESHAVTGMIGTIISGGFLYAIAALNMLALTDIWRQFRRTQTGASSHPESEKELGHFGLLNRLLSPLMKLITRPWQMYFVGLLFGLGFDTVDRDRPLLLSGAGAASGIPWYAILCLPVLFAAGMLLIDTIDGSLMNIAYGWALARPAGRIGYNLAVTALSVTVAFGVGTVETLGLISDRLRLQGVFWRWIAAVDLNCVGPVIVGLFVLAWGAALVASKVKCHVAGRMTGLSSSTTHAQTASAVRNR